MVGYLFISHCTHDEGYLFSLLHTRGGIIIYLYCGDLLLCGEMFIAHMWRESYLSFGFPYSPIECKICQPVKRNIFKAWHNRCVVQSSFK